jgi:heptosyltransferase-2
VKGALLVISNDSSPVHVAISVGTPVVEIYGATVPEFGFFPYRNGVYVEVKGLPCRPCGIHGGRKCPEGHFKCMVDLKPEVVIEKAEELLSSLS